MPIRHFLTLRPLSSTASSALTYVPAVLISRGLAFLRTLIVAWLLAYTWRIPATRPASAADPQSEFGLYQTSLEFVNLLVPLLMLGAGDVVERYLSQIARDRGPQALLSWTRNLLLNLLLRALPALIVLYLCASLYMHNILAPGQYSLLNACLLTTLLLALYQFLASLLRALRAYGAAAGLELSSALLLLAFSALAALAGRASHLMIAYAASVLLPLVLYGPLAYFHLKKLPTSAPPLAPASSVPPPSDDVFPYASEPARKSTRAYAAFTLMRLLLMMLYGFLAIWGVRHLAQFRSHLETDELAEAAMFALPYRIAQLLGFLGITLWSSTFAIAAASWSHGSRRRARAQFFRTGRLGAALLVLCATILLLARPMIAHFLPESYRPAILSLLPGMLALFSWYALLAFFSAYADLQESPQKGTLLWLTATMVQLAAILSVEFKLLPLQDPKSYMLTTSAVGLATPLFLLVPPLLCRPFRFSATAVPLLILSLAPISLLSPDWVVVYIATPILLAALVFLYTANLVIRPQDKRAFRRWISRLKPAKTPVDRSIV